MIKGSNKRTEWVETVRDALLKLRSDRSTFLLKPISPLLDNIINIDTNKLLFHSILKNEIEKVNMQIKVPEQMNILFSSFFVSYEKAELLTIDQIYYSPNLINRIGNTNIIGIITAAKMIGTDLNNHKVEIKGIIFNPGWSIPVNINNLKGKDVLITLGKFNFILFYDANSESIVISELL
ncbi:hypothetical protein [Picrophilus oshimae]|uniref:Uncharacterized protein n=1 Tax=Picrophilus torridus (strain ATCC 700027 / DSM 9790 / JCM 10055 / NBRC 100828 / KAW 2/3) TaxID=1122961 RepID=A0A8G2L7V5_PICTO|nr:hypothetical protein [Picrophilus oshimae]SMD31420.1 hypothetical protein SAMN02745355_1355 [Picrophilus oshimae DSM 9789]